VRTPSFKRWFGDWEKNARLRKLLEAKVVELTGYKGQYALDYKSALAWLKKQDGTLHIPDTGETVRIGSTGRKKVLSHSRENEAHLKSVASLQQMLSGATFIEETRNEKGEDGKYDAYRYYVAGVKIDGVDYTAKIAIGVTANGELYYDHALSQIEKGALLDTLRRLKSPVRGEERSSLDGVKDKRLLSLLQAENASKVVDENGEPAVVYHGTEIDEINDEHFAFDRTKSRSTMDIQGNFFSSREEESRGYGKNVHAFFLNIRKPASGDEGYKALRRFKGENDAGIKAREYLVKQGFDGVNREGEEFIAFENADAKSATDNDGSFSPDNPDIRYSRGGYSSDGSISNRGWRALRQGKEPAATIAYNLGVSVQGAEEGMGFLQKHDAVDREWHHVGENFEEVDFYDGHLLYEVEGKKASEITDKDEAVAYAALVVMRTHEFGAKPKKAGSFSAESRDAYYSEVVQGRAEGLAEAKKRRGAAEDALGKALDSGENITEALVEFENASVDYKKKHDAAVKAFLKKHGNEWRRERPQRGRAIGGDTEVRYSVSFVGDDGVFDFFRDEESGKSGATEEKGVFPRAPVSRVDSAAVKAELSKNRPVPFAGSKLPIVAAHPELFRRIGNLAKAAGGRVIDAFAGAGTKPRRNL